MSNVRPSGWQAGWPDLAQALNGTSSEKASRVLSIGIDLFFNRLTLVFQSIYGLICERSTLESRENTAVNAAILSPAYCL